METVEFGDHNDSERHATLSPDLDLDVLLAQARGGGVGGGIEAAHLSATGGARELQCCCGRPQCAYLAHNSAALEGLEKDLVSAAQIGQALLVRHQSHMAESEAERRRMSTAATQLETEKTLLETDNAKQIEENRELLNRLEELNHQVSDADVQVQSLTASLQATQAELQRLTALTARAASLEAQLLALESEHAQLQTELATSTDGQRSALLRWRRAESIVGELQSQMDAIEREGREERERHLEVMARMERTRTVEKELDRAAGRVKNGLAATSALAGANGRPDPGSPVVSRFVRDILQDNANLQSGVLEMRELLLSSNVEVETLREQLRMHRPMDAGDVATPSLAHELQQDNSTDPWSSSTSTTTVATIDQLPTASAAGAENSSLHVHHHYHAPNITVRKAKTKKRPLLGLAPPQSVSSGASTPRASASRIRDWRANTSVPSNSFATILAQTSASVPAAERGQHRWSTQSTNTLSSIASSGPSSPRQESSVFDAIDGPTTADLALSQPTTPASSLPSSPCLDPADITPRKPTASTPKRSVSGPLPLQLKARPSLGELGSLRAAGEGSNLTGGAWTGASWTASGGSWNGGSLNCSSLASPAEPITPFGTTTILEESEHADAIGPNTITTTKVFDDTKTHEPSYLDELAAAASTSMRPTLRRAASHESLLSVSGMDIHTLRDRPSQLLFGTGGSGIGISPLSPLFSSRGLASPFDPHAHVNPATARPAFHGRASDGYGAEQARSLLASVHRDGGGGRPSLTRKMGGWVWGKWAGTGAEGEGTGAGANSIMGGKVTPGKEREREPLPPRERSYGINQKGPIPGLMPPPKAPTQVETARVDSALLRDALGEVLMREDMGF